jgi:hypothetical protein
MATNAVFADRALAIHDIARSLRRQMELVAGAGTVADKMEIVEVGVEVVNKILFAFHVSAELLDGIEDSLNRSFREMQPTPSGVNRLFARLMIVVRRFEQSAADWVRRY